MQLVVTKADLDRDCSIILNFWNNNFPGWPKEKLAWFYNDNIYGRADCWLLVEPETQMVVGSTALFPRRLYSKGKSYFAGIAGDFAIDRKHRILGPALQLQKALVAFGRSGKYDLLYATPNSKSEPIQLRAGYHSLGSSIRWVRVLKTERHIGKYLSINILSTALGKLSDKLFFLAAKESRFPKGRSYQFAELPQTDQRFDDLWQRAKDNYPLIGERNWAFLQWRFDQCPYKKYRIFTATDKSSDSLVGYIVYHLGDNVITVDDMLTVSYQDYGEVLLPGFLQHVRKGEYDSIVLVSLQNQQITDILRKYHFLPRAKERNIIMFPGNAVGNEQVFFDAGNWHFFQADND